MIKIEKASVCFMSKDMSVAMAQHSRIDKSILTFEMVPYFAAERSGSYQSYSQLANETVDDSECEFMIFLNPKCVVSSEDLNLIIEKLSCGYCFAGVFGFAYCGISKQVFREIGMFDERFVAGEYEDNDFLLRMRLLGKAVWWGQDWSKYQYFPSKCPPSRGSSLSFFWKKWRWNGISVKKLDFEEKKISRRHSTERKDISNSWLGWDHSWGEGPIWKSMGHCEIDRSGWTESEEISNFKISYTYTQGSFKIEMNGDRDTAISFFLTTEERIPIYMHLVYQNTWHMAPIGESSAELRLYHDGNTIYINRISEGDEGTIEFSLPSSICK